MLRIGMIPVLAQKLSAPLSLAINAVLLQLILHKSPKEIGKYKYLLCYISLFEVIFAVLNVLIQPDFFSHSSVFLVVARSDRLHVPIWFIYMADALFCGMFGMSMAIFALHFVFRYLVITGHPHVKKITWKKLLIWLMCPLLYGALWITVVVTTLSPNESSDKILSTHFLPGKDLVIQEITYVGPNYYTTDGNQESMNWNTIFGMIILDSMVTSSIIIILIFATKCYKKVSAIANSFNYSKSYRDLQSQLLNSLVAQIIIPAVLMQAPALYLFTFPVFHMGNEFAGSLFCTAVAIYPVLDPLPTMFMIQHYRKALLETVTPNRKTPGGAKKQRSSKTLTVQNAANVA